MTLSAKSLRDLETVAKDPLEFDFGEPSVVDVEIADGKFLTLHEPSAEDLIEITKISSDKSLNDVEATLRTICILHTPSEGGRKLTIKDAKRLRSRQIRKLGEAINDLLGVDEGAQDDMKSQDQP